jgi:hypothetical protein
MMISASSRKYQAPTEFEAFARQFHQDIMEDVSTEEELIDWVLSPLKDNAERQRLRAYLDSITQDDVTDEELRKLWYSSSADFIFYDGAELRAFLKRVRARL